MLAFALFNLLLLQVRLALASNNVHYANGWIPITRPFMFNQMSNSYMETRHASVWKPSHNYDQSNSDYIKNDALLIITPKQIQGAHNDYNIHEQQASSEEIATPESNKILVQNDLHSNELLQEDIEEENSFPDNQTHNLSKFNLRDGMRKINVTIDITKRAPKQLWDPSAAENLLLTELIAPHPNMKTTETKTSIIVKNLTKNNYEVTEPTNVQELSYKTDDVHNEYTDKFVHLLSKYNIKAQDISNNYARSKLHQNKVIRMYPASSSPIPFIPYRYNSLNHLPVNPLLAVFLSNYGYYLHGFYGLPNNYKNLYGYSASNNIHNNKPFGSYKIYSDTDSSN